LSSKNLQQQHKMSLLRCSQLLTKNTVVLSNIKILGVNSSAISDITNVRNYSQRPKSFFGGIVDNLKEEFNKNKELKDSVKKFREEAKKLEESDALKEARNKYVIKSFSFNLKILNSTNVGIF
jgi:hypothetical protein